MNYLVQCTRPDLSFCWSYLSQFLNSPTLTHQQQFIHILCYLKLTKDLGITLGGPADLAFNLFAYCDADHASSIDRQSFTGSVLLLHVPIMWRCSKQAVPALLTTKAEHHSCSESGQDLLWATQLLSLLSPLFNCTPKPPSLLCDDQGAIALLENPLYQHRTRHIDVRLHWIRQHLAKGVFNLQYIPSGNNAADGMTKVISPQLTRKFIKDLRLTSLQTD